jgi:glycosyltransferase involved in cell wall biosynthesis
MRIAIVETSPLGGLLHYSAQLADALAGRGHTVDLVVTRGNELAGSASRARSRAVLTPQVPPGGALPPSGLATISWRAGILARVLRTWSRVLWECRPGRYDVVMLGDVALPPITVFALALTAMPRGPAVVEICHNVRDSPYGRLGRRLLSSFYSRADLVLVHGERSERQFHDRWPPATVGTIPHGDERLFGAEPPPPSGEEHILFFGNWRDVKGLHVLADAFDALAARRPAAKLTIAGRPFPDSKPGEIRAWANRHDGRVRLIEGYIPIEDVRPLFAAARVVVTPYLEGSQSGVVHLAMTMGRAVVATDVGDIGTTVVDGETGRVVPAGDAAALAEGLGHVVADRRLAARMGAAGRARLDDGSTWEKVAELLEPKLELAVGIRGSREEC